MKLNVHAGVRRWVVTRNLLSWSPRLRGRSFAQPLPLGGAWAGISTEYAKDQQSGRITGLQGLTSASVNLLIVIPFFVLQVIAWLLVALVTMIVKTTRHQPWAVTAHSEHLTPLHMQEDVVGWFASGRRAKALASELESGVGHNTLVNH